MTLHPSDLQTLERTQAELRRIEDQQQAQAERSLAARMAAASRHLGGRTGYVIAGATGLLIVLVAAFAF